MGTGREKLFEELTGGFCGPAEQRKGNLQSVYRLQVKNLLQFQLVEKLQRTN